MQDCTCRFAACQAGINERMHPIISHPHVSIPFCLASLSHRRASCSSFAYAAGSDFQVGSRVQFTFYEILNRFAVFFTFVWLCDSAHYWQLEWIERGSIVEADFRCCAKHSGLSIHGRTDQARMFAISLINAIKCAKNLFFPWRNSFVMTCCRGVCSVQSRFRGAAQCPTLPA